MTKAQERARERRRYEKRQLIEAERAAQRRRNRQSLAVAGAAVVVVGGFVALAMKLGSSSDDTPGQSVTAAANTGLLAGQQVLAGCSTPPPLQTTPKQFTAVPNKATAAGKTFEAKVTTNCGVITMQLDGTKAPQTVASFLALAKDGYWSPSPCHRLTTEGIFVLQCGDPTGTGSGGPGYTYGIENAPPSGDYPPGTLAMARTSDPNSNGGQFFVVYKDTKLPTEGGGYTIFGKVTSGLDLVNKIAAAGSLPTASGSTAPVAPISIVSIAVTEKKA